jgi:hypothetical protein
MHEIMSVWPLTMRFWDTPYDLTRLSVHAMRPVHHRMRFREVIIPGDHTPHLTQLSALIRLVSSLCDTKQVQHRRSRTMSR